MILPNLLEWMIDTYKDMKSYVVNEDGSGPGFFLLRDGRYDFVRTLSDEGALLGNIRLNLVRDVELLRSSVRFRDKSRDVDQMLNYWASKGLISFERWDTITGGEIKQTPVNSYNPDEITDDTRFVAYYAH